MVWFAKDYVRAAVFVPLQILKKPASITAADILSAKKIILDRTGPKESLVTDYDFTKIKF